jgi:Tfp pilus assembly protein PilF
VLRTDRPDEPIFLGPHQDVRNAAVHPEGRWVATGSWEGPGAQVWDLQTRRCVKDLRVGRLCGVQFSPDGRWLVTGTHAGKLRLWKVGTWQEGPPAGVAGYSAHFSPDGRLLACEAGNGVIRLVDPATGKKLARLENPDQATSGVGMAFSPDGTRLVAPSENSRAIHVWDLRLIRQGLVKLGLDWKARPYPPAPASATRPAPLRVEVDPGALAHFRQPPGETPQQRVERCSLILRADPDDVEAYHQRGHAYEALGKFALAVADFTEALKRRPDDVHFLAVRGNDHVRLRQYEAAVADLERSLALQQDQADICNLLARVRLRGSQQVRDPKKALALANRAVKLGPRQAAYLGTLGMALYHNDRPGEAVVALQKSLEGDWGLTSAFHLFYLAMCHHRLGNARKAKDCFDRAVRWRDEHRSLAAVEAELFGTYRTEAAKALGIAAE